MIFIKKLLCFEKLNPQTKEKEDLKEKVKDNTGDLFNELYYVYQDKYNEKKNGLNMKNKKKFDQKKMRLADDYEYESDIKEKKSK